MSNVIDINRFREQRDSETDYEPMETEIRDSMRESVSVAFLDRMVNHYGCSPSYIAMDIFASLIARMIHELDSGDDGAREVILTVRDICTAVAERESIDESDEARDEYYAELVRHRTGDRCHIVGPDDDTTH